jgi:hypothetical protein
MAVMHEEVHQRAGEEEKEWQIGNDGHDVGFVLGPEKKAGDRQESQKDHACA